MGSEMCIRDSYGLHFHVSLTELTPGAAAGIAPGAAADGTGAEAVVELVCTCTVRCGAAPPDPDPEDPGLFFWCFC